MRNTRFSGVKLPRTALDAATEQPIIWRMHNSDSSSRNFAGSNAVAPGYPTWVVLGSTSTALPGGWVVVSGAVGMTELNGTWRVLWVNGTTVALDVDSTDFTAWASGGTLTPLVIADEFGLIPAMAVQGTTTNVFANPTFGITSHSAGTHTLLQTAGISAMDLTSHAGCVAWGCDIYYTSNPSAKEYLFCLGVETATGSNTAAGCINMYLNTTGSIAAAVRPQGAANGDCSNTFLDSGALATSTRKSVVFILDMSVPAAWTYYVMVDGVFARSGAITMTGSIGGPSAGVGLTIGALPNTSLVLGSKFGAAGTPSAGRLRNLFFWKTSKTVTQTMRAVSDFQRRKLLSYLMV